jgi:WS/DGAT/MGAT family acyltransferase
MPRESPRSEPLSPEDLTFWWADQPRQRTAMAMLMLLDRRPDPTVLRAAVLRAVEAVPRLRQRIVDAPFGLALPRWECDPTFDVDFHVRRYALAPSTETRAAAGEMAELFHTLGPIYERPFDRTRPLWELIEIDRPHGRAALFFRLHHAVADGVGGNAIVAALTDATREGEPLALPSSKPPGGWSEEPFALRLARALRDRVEQDLSRARAVAGAAWQTVREPRSIVRGVAAAESFVADALTLPPVALPSFGRARHLTGFDVPFGALRELRRAWGGTTIDVLLTAIAGAVRRWYTDHALAADEVLTLVPVNLRARAEQGLAADTGNRATGILLRLPLAIEDPRARFEEVHRRVEERKTHPATTLLPATAAVMAALPRPLYRELAHAASGSVGLIATNVPGVPVPRYVAGAEITAAYPFAPVAPRCPVSIALYGYRDRLYVGLDADGTAMPDLDAFRAGLIDSFEELSAALRTRRAQRAD